MSLSVIVASGGRPTLARTIASITAQLDIHDEMLCIIDQCAPYGHSSRNRMMRFAKGDHLAFCDDDDEYTPDAFQTIRAAIAEHPDAAQIFHARHPDGSTAPAPGMIVVANRPPLATWGRDFPGSMSRHRTTIRHDTVIALIRPR